MIYPDPAASFSGEFMMSSLTQDGEREQEVLEHLGPDFGTFGLRPGLDGLQVTLVHPHLNLFRHTVGTVMEKTGERRKQNPMSKCKLHLFTL